MASLAGRVAPGSHADESDGPIERTRAWRPAREADVPALLGLTSDIFILDSQITWIARGTMTFPRAAPYSLRQMNDD